MLELQTLGRAGLVTDDGRSLDRVLRQPKRFALLVYLAKAREPGSLHRRDVLLARFWPELDLQHARDALNSSLHFLRSEIGEGVLLRRGQEEVGVDHGQLRCDAVTFEQLVRDAHHECAVSLYHGDFLEGFHIPDSPDFGEWLDIERPRMRDLALHACAELAKDVLARGALEEAADWSRRALAIDPDYVPAILTLMQSLKALGDVTGVIRHYDQVRQRFDREYGVQLPQRIRELFEEIQRRP